MTVASENRVVAQIIEHGVKVHRKVFAGQPIPPDLVDAYKAAGGDVTGTGKGGNVLKKDKVDALKSAHATPESEA